MIFYMSYVFICFASTRQQATGRRRQKFPSSSSMSALSLPCSALVPPALSSVPLSSRKERKTNKRPHFAGEIWAFFCLCLLYIPVTLGAADRPPFPRRVQLCLPVWLLRESNTGEGHAALPVWTIKIKAAWLPMGPYHFFFFYSPVSVYKCSQYRHTNKYKRYRTYLYTCEEREDRREEREKRKKTQTR